MWLEKSWCERKGKQEDRLKRDVDGCKFVRAKTLRMRGGRKGGGLLSGVGWGTPVQLIHRGMFKTLGVTEADQEKA